MVHHRRLPERKSLSRAETRREHSIWRAPFGELQREGRVREIRFVCTDFKRFSKDSRQQLIRVFGLSVLVQRCE